MLLLSLTRAAFASWPEDVVLTNLAAYEDNTGAYHDLVRELGVAIANKPMAPGETLGLNGFDLSVFNSVSFLHARGTESDPSGWERTQAESDPNDVLWIPTIGLRKGLPLSLEAGLNVGWIGMSHQGILGGYGRWALVEGYRKAPDVTIQVGYTGYVGNEELWLGVIDTSATVGYTFPFGRTVGINTSRFSPYVGVGTVRIAAEPKLDDDVEAELGIEPVSGFGRGSQHFAEGFQPFVADVGFRVATGDFQVKLAGTVAPDVISGISFGVGFEY
jgi:hypothetical protein